MNEQTFDNTCQNKTTVLVTGATGYVGGRLYPLLAGEGYPVRCLVRSVSSLKRQLDASVEVIEGNVFNKDSLRKALQGIHTAYYLIHSMSSESNFRQKDKLAALNFAEAAQECGVQRIIYLGGLGDPSEDLSPHLRSRHEVGEVLASKGIPTLEFRASIVIGSGSLSYEMIRALVERLPVMIVPRWSSVLAQPIAIDDLLAYLVQASTIPMNESHIVEIGGADQVSYKDIMEEYARQRSLKRTMISIPFLTPFLSSLWLGLVTPVYARVGRILIDSIRNPTIVKSNQATQMFPIQPMGIRQAIARALINEDHEYAQTRWSDAVSSSGYLARWEGTNARVVDHQETWVSCSPEEAFRPIRQIGGKRGWYFLTSMWKIRAYIDLMLGGIGIRRGRRDPDHLRVGDALDWWRVEAYEPDHMVRLVAEMKVPGRAWLQFEVVPEEEGSTIHQTAIFDPLGLWGYAYWYALYPVHFFIFRGMIRSIARRALEPSA